METIELLLKKAENCLILNKIDKALEYYNLILEEDISNAEAWYKKAELEIPLAEFYTIEEPLLSHFLEEGFKYINTNKDYLKNIEQNIYKINLQYRDVNKILLYLENYIKNTDSLKHNILNITNDLYENYYFQKSFISIKTIKEQIITDKEVNFCLEILHILEMAYQKDKSNTNLLEAIINILVDKLSGDKKNLYKECNPKKSDFNGGYTRETIYFIVRMDIFFLSKKDEILFKQKLHKYSTFLSELNSNFNEPNIKRKIPQQIDNPPCPYGDSTCFVVTATVGNVNHPRVKIIRNFRDKTLSNYILGQQFIRWYYKNGPILAKLIKKNWLLKKFFYYFMVLPISEILRWVNNYKLKERG